MGYTTHKTTLPHLNCAMRAKRITNEALAVASGVSCRTISTVRAGGAIRVSLARIIEQTVYEREF